MSMTPAALIAIRERAGMDRAGLALLLGVSKWTVREYELGRRPIFEPVAKLAMILDRVGPVEIRRLS